MHLASKRVNAVGEAWRTAVDKTLLPWRAREAAEFKKANRPSRKKANRPGRKADAHRLRFEAGGDFWRVSEPPPPAAPPLRLSSSEISYFTSSYWKVVDSAAGHLADRLAQAMAFRQGLGQEQQKWIWGEIEEFAEKKSSREIVRGWIGIAISNPPEAEQLPGFDRLVDEICSRLDRPEPLFEPTHKLKLAVALMGEERARLVKTIPRGSINFEQLRGRASFSPNEAATMLAYSTRNIRKLVHRKKLNKAQAGGRIVNDQLWASEYQRRHKAPQS